jgi:hypothetical protein
MPNAMRINNTENFNECAGCNITPSCIYRNWVCVLAAIENSLNDISNYYEWCITSINRRFKA